MDDSRRRLGELDPGHTSPGEPRGAALRRGRLGRSVVATAIAAVAVLFGFVSSAAAGVAIIPAINIPASGGLATVGQSYASNVTLRNLSNGTTATESLTVDAGSIQIVPSCAALPSGSDCPSTAYDPTVFALSATATGAAGTACAGDSFAIDPIAPAAEGRYELDETSSGGLVLGPANGSAASATCEIDFTARVTHAPVDADPGPGLQTVELVAASATASAVEGGSGSGDTEITVLAAQPAIATAVSPSPIQLGQSFKDTATVTGAAGVAAPTGSVTFSVFGDPSCSTAPLFTSLSGVSTSGGVTSATSTLFTPTSAGSYFDVATYSGDANYAAVTAPCGAAGETEVVGQLVPAIATAVAPSQVPLGQPFADHATVSGSGGLAPTGTVTFSVFNNPTCTGTPVFSSANPLSTSGGVTGATSSSFTPAATGSYKVVASYSGDRNYQPVGTPCGAANETAVVTAAPATIVTAVSPATVSLGGSFSDTATMTGAAGAPAPTGTVSFSVYGPSDATCSGPVLFTSTAGVATSGGVTSATSSSFTPTTAGSYRVVAAYSGDVDYSPAIGACNAPSETAVVGRVSPTIIASVSPVPISLGQSFTDTATISGGGGPAPTGTVTFSVYGPGNPTCTGAPVFTSTNAVSTSGGSTTASSVAFLPTSSGSYSVVASYSGDTNFNGGTTACGASGQTEVVSPASASLATAVSPTSIQVGQSFTDTATLTGPAGVAAPTGTVSFTVYGSSTCSGTPVFTSTGSPLSTTGGVTRATSPSFAPTAGGQYFVVAHYSGDANYPSVTGACGAPGETIVVGPGVATIATAVSPTSIALGAPFTDRATVSGPAGAPAPTGTVSFSVYGPNDVTCSKAPAFTTTGTALSTSGGVTSAISPSLTPTAAGSYFVVAAYSGDANYPAVVSPCGASGEIETVGPATPGLTTAVAPSTISLGQPFTDRATLTGAVGAPTPTGTVVFTVFANSTCTGAAVFTSPAIVVTTTGGVTSASGPPFTPTASGTYFAIASYSGDANYQPLTAPCGAPGETEVVNKTIPAIATAVSPTPITLGQSFTDRATLTSAGPTPTGTVSFSVFASATCSGAALFSSTNAVSTTGGVTSATSAAFTPTVPGSYFVVATYSGDANDSAVSGACGAAGETAVVRPVSPVFTADTPPLTGKVGTPYASYTFAASGNPKPTFAVTAGSLPTGLALNATTGVLSGTPSTPGSFTFTVGATNGSGTDASSGPITVAIAAGPTQITGRVTNAAGTPLANICVYPYASGATGARTADSGTCTDATGAYALNLAAAGSYNVAFFDPSGVYVTQWANGKPSEATANAIVVTSGAQTTGVNATMTGVTQITGTVTNSAAAPVANVCVYLYAAGATGARTSDPGACTNAAGQYTMHVAVAGSYNVAFFDPSGIYVTQWYHGQPSEAAANPVSVAAGATTTAVNAQLVGVTRIVGTVTNTAGAPLSNICVYLYAAGTTGARTADTGVCTNAAGTYSMPVAAAASYNVAFFDPSGVHTTQWANGKSSEATANPVTVTSGAQTVVNATLTP